MKALQVIDSVVETLDSCRAVLKKNQAQRIRSNEEKALVKATVFSWFNDYREIFIPYLDSSTIEIVDNCYHALLSLTDKSTTRDRYLKLIDETKDRLINLRGPVISSQTSRYSLMGLSYQSPDISPLVHDPKIQAAIERRWIECVTCIEADAPLAAIVMIGGLVETMLLARINRESNKKKIFTATSAPKDRKSGNTLPLKKWTLRNYIDVAHEIKWISHSAKDVSEILGEYRNYIHPFKEISHGVALERDDARVIWEVAKSIVLQILSSV
jgi:hypothetical protein